MLLKMGKVIWSKLVDLGSASSQLDGLATGPLKPCKLVGYIGTSQQHFLSSFGSEAQN